MKYIKLVLFMFSNVSFIEIVADLNVNNNLEMSESADQSTGNINKNDSYFIHNFGNNNVFAGLNAGNFTLDVQKASRNSGFGVNALSKITTGQENTAVGKDALLGNEQGSFNTAVGYASMLSNVEGSENVIVGADSLKRISGNKNALFGNSIITATNAMIDPNTAIGNFALNITIDTQFLDRSGGNVAVGFKANKDGVYNNIAIGRETLQSFETDNCVAVGVDALFNLSTSNTVAIGKDALRQQNAFGSLGFGDVGVGVGVAMNTDLIRAKNSIFLGFKSGSALTLAKSHIYIAAPLDNDTEDISTLRIGNSTHRKCIMSALAATGGRSVGINPNSGLVGVILASRSIMDTIGNIEDKDSARIYQLTPVAFVYNYDANNRKQFGLIAEEVEHIFPQLVAYDKEGEPLSVYYEQLSVLLLSEIQRQKQDLIDHKQIIEEQVKEIKELTAVVVALQNQMKSKAR